MEEYTVLETYSARRRKCFKTSTTENGAFMNAHHGIQTKWAEDRINDLSKKIIGKELYDPEKVPVILLRDTYEGTPHQYITKNQKARERDISNTDFEYQRKKTVDELSYIGCPGDKINKFLSESDEFFKSIYKELQNEIKNSDFTDYDKECFYEDLQDIFGNFFEKNRK